MIVTRWHEISCAHRIYGYPGKCGDLHGHNYRIYFHCEGEISDQGMVIDFSLLKATLCRWLDVCWDHKLLLWEKDPITDIDELKKIGMIAVPFNPTAENMADFLLREVGPMVLPESIKLVEVVIEETSKCSVSAYPAEKIIEQQEPDGD